MKRLISICISVILLQVASANPNAVKLGFKAGGNMMTGDLTNADYPLSSSMNVYFGYPLSSNFTLNLSTGYQKLVVEPQTAGKITNQLITPVNLYGEYYLPINTKINPYIDFGTGIGTYKEENESEFDQSIINFIGAGTDIALSENFSLTLSARYNYPLNDELDNQIGGSYNDVYYDFKAGIAYNFGQVEKKEQPEVAREEPEAEFTKDTLLVLQQKIQNLENEVEKYKALNKDRNEKINSLIKLIKQKNNVIDSLKKAKTKTKTTSETAEKSKEKEVPKIEEEGVDTYYNGSLNAFRNRDYNKAISRFKKLHEKYPNHQLAGNFVYWIGESYFGLEKYEKALEYFNKVREYPKSYKLDDALVMAGYSYYRLGNKETAKQKFKKLLTEYPDSEYRDLAKNLINNL